MRISGAGNMKRNTVPFAVTLFFAASLFSQTPGSAFIADGYDAYRNGDWTTALLIFKRAVVTEEYATEENYFMLVMSEMFSRRYTDAVGDTERFIKLFPASRYLSYIAYQRGRALHLAGDNAKALAELSAFCHRWPRHEFYSSALYWIAECFYADYDFETARALYQRIVDEFPRDAKAADSRYRIEAITQRIREEKLLYLLKVISEEYLAATEEYEKLLSLNRVEEMVEIRKQMRILNSESEDLKKELEEARRIYDEQMRLLNESNPLLQYEGANVLNYRLSDGVITVDPALLAGEYDQDREGTDTRYRGKTLRITGTLFYIGELHDDEYYVNLYDGKYNIDVYIRMSEADKLKNLSPGATITILGTYAGSMDITDALIVE
jgi:outer membrane protein assembly factor BamD (BamD/ComL family)